MIARFLGVLDFFTAISIIFLAFGFEGFAVLMALILLVKSLIFITSFASWIDILSSLGIFLCVGYGFNPIRNLSGHEVEQWNLHAGMIIPNYDNKSETVLEEGKVFAVEPFASTGSGKVDEGKLGGVYRIQDLKSVRVGRDILDHIYERFKGLPFSKDWLHGNLNEFKLNNGFRILEQQGLIHRYPELVEEFGSKVSQAEHTVMVADKPIILTKID